MSVQVSYKKQFALGFLLIIILIGVIEISVRVYEVTLPECVWINFDAFEPMVISAKKSGIKRFIYASTSSVYGVFMFWSMSEN